MVARRTVTVSITPRRDALLRPCLNAGRYGDVGGIMRAALRPLEREDAATLHTIGSSTVRKDAARA